MYIEGLITKPESIGEDVRFINNQLSFIFSDMKYELNGVSIQKLMNPVYNHYGK